MENLRNTDISVIKHLSVKYILDLMMENKKKKFGFTVCSSEKVDMHDRYAPFAIASIPYPGVEFFQEFNQRNHVANDLRFDWDKLADYVQLKVDHPTSNIGVSWQEYKTWDLVLLTQNYLKLMLQFISDESPDSGLLVHCISGWDRTPLFISLLRISLWADGEIHQSLSVEEMLYLTVAYDWLLFSHQLSDRASRGEDIFYFCFYFLQFIHSSDFSVRSQRRQEHKEYPTRTQKQQHKEQQQHPQPPPPPHPDSPALVAQLAKSSLVVTPLSLAPQSNSYNGNGTINSNSHNNTHINSYNNTYINSYSSSYNNSFINNYSSSYPNSTNNNGISISSSYSNGHSVKPHTHSPVQQLSSSHSPHTSHSPHHHAVSPRSQQHTHHTYLQSTRPNHYTHYSSSVDSTSPIDVPTKHHARKVSNDGCCGEVDCRCGSWQMMDGMSLSERFGSFHDTHANTHSTHSSNSASVAHSPVNTDDSVSDSESSSWEHEGVFPHDTDSPAHRHEPHIHTTASITPNASEDRLEPLFASTITHKMGIGAVINDYVPDEVDVDDEKAKRRALLLSQFSELSVNAYKQCCLPHQLQSSNWMPQGIWRLLPRFV
jgi:myotubularin-related protein 14